MPLDLDHSKRVYGFWGRHPLLYSAADWPLFLGRRARIRQRALDAMGLKGSENVLELACGPGVNFARLERTIGPSGSLTGLDYSEEMLASARERAQREGWRNIEFLQGDAARTALPAESFDAALCILGLSVVSDHEAAIARVQAALKSGGRFVVLDGRLDRGPARPLSLVLKPLFRKASNADTEKALVADLERAFDSISVEEFNGGSLFIITAQKATNRVETNGE
jgi:S-adenosylmethionine-diacylgycerolhomoserine-N-methlytransferase